MTNTAIIRSVYLIDMEFPASLLAEILGCSLGLVYQARKGRSGTVRKRDRVIYEFVWDQSQTNTAIAKKAGCHPQRVRELRVATGLHGQPGARKRTNGCTSATVEV